MQEVLRETQTHIQIASVEVYIEVLRETQTQNEIASVEVYAGGAVEVYREVLIPQWQGAWSRSHTGRLCLDHTADL